MSNVMGIKVKYIDSVCCEIISGNEFIKEALSYRYEYWTSGRLKKQKRIGEKSFVFGTKIKYFYTGFLTRLKKYCEAKGILFELIGEPIKISHVSEPNLPGVEFRDIQIQAINEIHSVQRGTVNLSTGIGKTIFAAGLLSTYSIEDQSLLFLCRSNDLVRQASETFSNLGFKNCQIGDGNKQITEKIVFATAQTWKTMPLIDLACEFSIVCCDEAHKGFGSGGEYEEILSKTLSPIRVALTGTLSTKEQNSLLLEGLIGPPIIRADTTYGIKENILMKPEIKFISYPLKKISDDYKTYRDVYKNIIVNNNARHNAIAKSVKEENEQGNSCLVFCVEIDHIKFLSEAFAKNGIEHECVFGETGAEERGQVKKSLESKELMACISSTIWVEGVDVRSLGVVMDCGGGKSQEALLQRLGRAIRTKEGKNSAKFYLVLDQGKYLADHVVTKLSILNQQGLL